LCQLEGYAFNTANVYISQSFALGSPAHFTAFHCVGSGIGKNGLPSLSLILKFSGFCGGAPSPCAPHNSSANYPQKSISISIVPRVEKACGAEKWLNWKVSEKSDLTGDRHFVRCREIAGAEYLIILLLTAAEVRTVSM
jgi:hypothetical protein